MLLDSTNSGLVESKALVQRHFLPQVIPALLWEICWRLRLRLRLFLSHNFFARSHLTFDAHYYTFKLSSRCRKTLVYKHRIFLHRINKSLVGQ
uniref:Putative ovule protein n=1 Tax=Solanum chacoense TaxID=4108 RepID=A0A0V0I218_SOLCH